MGQTGAKGDGYGYDLIFVKESTELAIDYKDNRGLNKLRFFQTDPFDGLLISQASHRPVYLATLDENIIKTYERDKAFRIFTDHASEE